MIIIRKLLSLFLVLVVITSISVTAFAAGEQPSGSSYQYYNGTTTTNYDTFWSAMSKGLVYIGQQVRQINSYFSSNNNWLSTINANLNDIKLAVDPTSSAANFAHPSGSNYSYYTFQDTTSSSNFWVAVNSQLQYLSNRINSIKNSQATISSTVSSMGTSITNIDTSTASIDNKLPNRTYMYVLDDGTIKPASESTANYWTATANSIARIGADADSIFRLMPTGTFYSVTSTGLTSTAFDYWNSVTRSLTWIGQFNYSMKNNIEDLHTMFASPEDLALKADQENNISAATSNFLSGSDSATSVGTGSIGKVKDLGDDAAAWFDTGVQATSLFDALSNDDTDDGPWMWFTQATMDDLDSTSSNRSFKGSSSPGEYVPDFYGAKMDELNRMLGAFSE